MRKLLSFLWVLFLLFSCSKEELNNRAINGKWKTDKFTISDYQGLKHYTETTGFLQFSPTSKKGVTGTYNFELYFDFNDSPRNLIQKGSYKIHDKNNLLLTSETGETTQVTIVYHTKEDLILDFPNVDYLGYYTVLKKIE
jgi:hypothetical protein